MIKIQISMDPVAKGRHRSTVSNGQIRTYTPEKTQVAEEELRYRFFEHQDKAFPQYVPVRLSVTFYLVKSKWKNKPAEKLSKNMPAWRPDTDNFLKLVLDSMNGILVYDDSQITTIWSAKRWSTNGKGSIVIRLEEDKP